MKSKPSKYLNDHMGNRVYTDKVIADVNNLMLSTKMNFMKHLQSLPLFGHSISHLSYPEQVECVIYHRLFGKFEAPSQDRVDELKQKCFLDWKAFESDHLRPLNIKDGIASLSPEDQQVLWKSRAFFQDMLKSYKPNLRNAHIHFPPGETFVSSKGKVSVFQKLKLKKHWTTTWNLLDQTTYLIYHHPSLKRCAKKFFVQDLDQDKELFQKYKYTSNPGYRIFAHKLKTDVLTIVDGSRASSVYKDSKKRRFINVETMFGSIIQNLLAQFLRKQNLILGNDLEQGQAHHREMISNLFYATIDFSNASDSNHFDSVTWFCDSPFAAVRSFYNQLVTSRSYSVKLNGEWEIPHKMSSMGNGFTFELMTTMLLSIARSLDATARVYGDDVVLDKNKASQFIRITTALGWLPNYSKTFMSGTFRESCGAFYAHDYGYVTCYDFTWCENISDVVVLCNKLYRIVEDCKIPHLRQTLASLHKSFLHLLPLSLKGPRYHDCDVLSSHVWCDQAIGQRFTSRFEKARYERWVNEFREVFRDIQIPNWKGKVDLTNFAISVVNIPVYKPVLASRIHERKVFKMDASFASILYQGMRSKDIIRNEGEWQCPEAIITADGYLFTKSFLEHLKTKGLNTSLV